MAFQGFAFSEDTSSLSDVEFERACETLAWARDLIARRAALVSSDPAKAALALPDEGWRADHQPSFELDGATRNAQTSYELLAQGDRDIIRKMRLYGHSFTGYQLATLALAAQRPWLSRKLPDNWDEVLRFLAGPPDQAVMDYVAVAGALPSRLRVSPPRKFGEIGWLIDDVIINDDTYAYQERLALMYENALIKHLDQRLAERGILKVIEIGGGYGGLAHHLMKVFEGKLRYTIVDIPESLAFSAIYLGTLHPQDRNLLVGGGGPIALPAAPGFSFVANFDHEQLTMDEDEVDLVINTLSLSEMSDNQIDDYCRAVSRWIGRSGIFFEQNHQSDHLGPGDVPPLYLKNLRKCTTQLLPASFPARRGDANLWVNASYRG